MAFADTEGQVKFSVEPSRAAKDVDQVHCTNDRDHSKTPSHVRLEDEVRDHGFERLLDTVEAAKLLCVHPKTLQALARSGSVPSVRMGKYWRFRSSSLDTWVREGIESSHQSRRVL